MSRHIFIIVYAFIALNISAQAELSFVRYTAREGLIHDDVLSIYQDHFGFMWFGTKSGCSKFDGIEFKNYPYNENDSNSMNPGWVNKITGDGKNSLWFALTGRENSFIRYDYNTDQFINITDAIEKQSNVIPDKFDLWNLYLDSKGYIWMGATGLGFTYYNPENGETKIFKQENTPSQGVSFRDFMEDGNQNMWFATSPGLFFYNRKENSFKYFQHDPDNAASISSNNCQCLFKDSHDQIWIGTQEGLNRLIPSNQGDFSFKKYEHDPENVFSLSNNFIYDINETPDSNLLIATINGLCLMDKTDNKIYRYYNSDFDDESINSNLVRVIYRDKQDNIWIGTNNGIGKLQTKNFKPFSYSLNKNSISHNKVQYICEAPDSRIWIATPRGIDVLNKKTGQFNLKVNITKDDNGLHGAPIFLHSETNKGMWIGTWRGGISYFDYSKNKITKHINSIDNTLIDDVYSVFPDNKNRLWIGKARSGLYLLDRETGKSKVFSYDENNANSISSNTIYAILADSDNNIWIGTQNGLNLLLDEEKGSFRRYLPGTLINQVIEGSDKSIWVGTSKGLFRYNKNTEKFTVFNAKNGISGNVFGIVEDQSHDLWISSTDCFARLTPSSDSDAKIHLYRREEGLSIGNFNHRACAQLSDGSIAFGGDKGFCMFQPSHIKNDTIPPIVVFTGLKISNKKVDVGQHINGQIILKKSMVVSKRLILNHKNNIFSISFASLQYNLPQYTQCSYILEGYDLPGSGWHSAKTGEREVDYMNLPAGQYIFKVKAANSHGVWCKKAAELKITILPPWWETKWFIALLVLSFITLVLTFVKLRTRNLLKQKEKLKKLVEQRTLELEQQIKKTEEMARQLHDADQSKLRFFANISHEFKTPLSLIIAPLEKCLTIERPDNWNNIKNNYLKLVHKNAKRLLSLINQVIDFRKMDQGEKKLVISGNNIVEFIRDIAGAFSSLAEQKQINITVNSQYPVIDFWFDPDIMEKVLYNLISNAIKYTPEQGEISLQLSVNSQQ